METKNEHEHADRQEHDNWREQELFRCATCMWWVHKSGTMGRCRRHAPTLAGWPVVFPTDWCGDHKLTDEDAAERW